MNMNDEASEVAAVLRYYQAMLKKHERRLIKLDTIGAPEERREETRRSIRKYEIVIAALSQSASIVEPVAWMYTVTTDAGRFSQVAFVEKPKESGSISNVTPLYTHPNHTREAVIEECAKVLDDYIETSEITAKQYAHDTRMWFYCNAEAATQKAVAKAIRALSTGESNEREATIQECAKVCRMLADAWRLKESGAGAGNVPTREMFGRMADGAEDCEYRVRALTGESK